MLKDREALSRRLDRFVRRKRDKNSGKGVPRELVYLER